MSRRGDREFLSDILEAGQRIRAYVVGITYEQFMSDTKTQDAVIRNLEIIGEASKQLSADLRTKQAAVPWRSMIGIRDRLIHAYFGVNLDIVWQVVIEELPAVMHQIEAMLSEDEM